MLPFADRPYTFFDILSDSSFKNPKSVLGTPHYVIAALVDHVRQLFPFRHFCIVLRYRSYGKAHQDMTTAAGGGLLSFTHEYRKKRQFDVTPEPQGAAPFPKEEEWFAHLRHTEAHGLASTLRLSSGMARCTPLLGRAEGPFARSDGEASRDPDGRSPSRVFRLRGSDSRRSVWCGNGDAVGSRNLATGSADVESSLREGEIKFTVHGKKLQGSWVLIRARGLEGNGLRSAWLLVKNRDRFSSTNDVTQEEPRSAASRRLLADIARDEGGDIERASKGDTGAKSLPE